MFPDCWNTPCGISHRLCNFAFFSGLISAQFWAGRSQPKSPELGANLLVMFPVFHSQQQTTGERIIAA
ncbi:TPA: hypothetical protein GE328_20635 [Escherichia coli]|nr:hypothetical protein [Escherichia coli]